MARKVGTTFVGVLALIISLACLLYSRPPPVLISVVNLLPTPFPPPSINAIISQEQQVKQKPIGTIIVQREQEKPSSRHIVSTVSILLPAWEILVIIPSETPVPTDYDTGNYTCLFPNNDTSPAKPSGFLPFPSRPTFTCELPERVRRRLPFPQPILTTSPENPLDRATPVPELLRWNFLVYDSLTTEK